MIKRYDTPTVSRRLHGGARPLVLAVVALVALGALGGGGYLLVRTASASDGVAAGGESPQWAVVSRQSIPVTIVAEGEMVAKDQIDIINMIDHNGEERIESIIEEGTWVNEGDWLFTLSAPGLVSDRDEWESRVRESEAELEERRRNLEIERDTAASAEAKARLALELAQLAYEQWQNGTHPQQVRDLQLALEKAERELDQATRELAFSQELYAEDFISRTELEQDEIRLIEAQNAMESAKLDIQVYDNYEKVKAEKEAISEITQAAEELERTIRQNENRLELAAARIESETSEVEQRRYRLNDLERMVQAMEVHAPRSGLVIYASTIGVGRERHMTIRQSARVWGGQRVMVLSDTSQMVANLLVHESRIGEVKKGQQVSIRINARPGLIVPATIIEKKNSANQSTSGNPHLSQYMVLAELPANIDEGLRPGMNCSAEIFVREIDNALAVPVQAVHTEGDDHFVYVSAERGKVRRQVVEIGGASDTLVQVVTGLDEGTQVLLRNPMPGEVLRDAQTGAPVAKGPSGSPDRT